jgi:hypothetical protein
MSPTNPQVASITSPLLLRTMYHRIVPPDARTIARSILPSPS